MEHISYMEKMVYYIIQNWIYNGICYYIQFFPIMFHTVLCFILAVWLSGFPSRFFVDPASKMPMEMALEMAHSLKGSFLRGNPWVFLWETNMQISCDYKLSYLNISELYDGKYIYIFAHIYIYIYIYIYILCIYWYVYLIKYGGKLWLKPTQWKQHVHDICLALSCLFRNLQKSSVLWRVTATRPILNARIGRRGRSPRRINETETRTRVVHFYGI